VKVTIIFKLLPHAFGIPSIVKFGNMDKNIMKRQGIDFLWELAEF
jgi:hypothetical protein